MAFAAPTADELRRLPKAELERLARLATSLVRPPPAKYVPQKPTPKQWRWLGLKDEEAIYGGAAGGLKTSALLMAALQYVDVPGYRAVIIRRTFAQLSDPANGLIHRSLEWLGGTDAKWNGTDHYWRFPSGSTLQFKHFQHVTDFGNFQGAEYDFVGWDELTQCEESQYRYLFTRVRREAGFPVPARIRSATNPGGVGHDWVRRWFNLPEGHPRKPFIPSRIVDARGVMDVDDYTQRFDKVDSVTRRQLLEGDWTARRDGSLFRREWFEIVDALPADAGPGLRHWDLAATPESDGQDPDWTAGCRMHRSQAGLIHIADVRRLRASPGVRDKMLLSTASQDGRAIPIVIEQEPGASGKSQIEYLVRQLIGYRASGMRATGDKATRAGPLSGYAASGNVKLVRGAWNSAFLDELEAFDGSGDGHDDQVDAASGAFESLAQRNVVRVQHLPV